MEIFKDEKIKKIISKIQNTIKLTALEGKVFITGGAVRNALLKLPIHDIDVVVAVKDGGIILANLLAAKERCFVSGRNPVLYLAYGTAKLNLFKDEDIRDIDIECVDTRKNTYGTHDYFGTLEEDSKRRDLTINSLYWNISDGKVYDYNCGVDDLVNKTLRCVNPSTMFFEDPIKMLRIIRFSSELGWGIEKNTWLGIIQNSHRIKSVAQERITSEITKILVSPNASMGIRKLMYCGLLHRIMPDVYDLNKGYESKNPCVTAFDHTMQVLDTVQPHIESRLAALFHDVGSVVSDEHSKTIGRDLFSSSVAEHDLGEMKFSNDICKAVETAIKYHRMFNMYAEGVVPPDKKIRKFVNLCGEHIGTTIDLMNANNLNCTFGKKKKQVLDILERMEELDAIEEAKNVKLPIDGKILMSELKLKGGPMVGKLLDKIKDAYFENPNITKEECLEIAKEEIKVLAV